MPSGESFETYECWQNSQSHPQTEDFFDVCFNVFESSSSRIVIHDESVSNCQPFVFNPEKKYFFGQHDMNGSEIFLFQTEVMLSLLKNQKSSQSLMTKENFNELAFYHFNPGRESHPIVAAPASSARDVVWLKNNLLAGLWGCCGGESVFTFDLKKMRMVPSYLIQVGAFSTDEAAQKYADQLALHGITKTYIETKNLNVVFVYGYIEEQEAKLAAQDFLEKKWITEYKIVPVAGWDNQFYISVGRFTDKTKAMAAEDLLNQKPDVSGQWYVRYVFSDHKFSHAILFYNTSYETRDSAMQEAKALQKAQIIKSYQIISLQDWYNNRPILE